MKTLVILIASLMGSSLVASDASADMGSVYVSAEGVRVSELFLPAPPYTLSKATSFRMPTSTGAPSHPPRSALLRR